MSYALGIGVGFPGSYVMNNRNSYAKSGGDCPRGARNLTDHFCLLISKHGVVNLLTLVSRLCYGLVGFVLLGRCPTQVTRVNAARGVAHNRIMGGVSIGRIFSSSKDQNRAVRACLLPVELANPIPVFADVERPYDAIVSFRRRGLFQKVLDRPFERPPFCRVSMPQPAHVMSGAKATAISVTGAIFDFACMYHTSKVSQIGMGAR